MKLEGKLKNLFIAIIICWIILAIVFGLRDLEISLTLVNKDSFWAKIGKQFGEGPGYGIISVSIAILIGSRSDDLKKQRQPSYIIMIIGLFFIIIAFISSYLWFITFGGGIFIGILIFLILTRNRDLKDYRQIASVIILLAIINPLIFVQITKIMCGRVRFNDLSLGYSNYTPWFLPPGPLSGIKGNSSFPSGHTAMAFMLLPLIIQVKDRKWSDPIKLITIILVIGWGIFIAYSRIVAGDHYASDVLFSGGVATISTIFLYKISYKSVE